jgi:hypothetical protein
MNPVTLLVKRSPTGYIFPRALRVSRLMLVLVPVSIAFTLRPALSRRDGDKVHAGSPAQP